MSSRLFGTRFYLAVFAGVEKRAPERTHADGEVRAALSVLFDVLAFAWLLCLGCIFLVGLAVTGAYVVKSALGIDLFEGHTPMLHGLVFGA